MTGKEYLKSLVSIKVNKEISKKIISVYSDNLPEIVLKIASNAKEPIFLDDDSRILSYDEMIDAEQDLRVQFKEKGIIPLVDCGENDFIVYHFENKIWSKFNIVDETVFKKKDSLEELLE